MKRKPAPLSSFRRRSGSGSVSPRAGLIAAFSAGLVMIAGAPFLVPGTDGAFSARISNTSNTAGVRTALTCEAALKGTPDLIFGYPLRSLSPVDLSPNGNAGASSLQMSLASGDGNFGCVRDPQTSVYFNGNAADITSPHVWTTKSTTPPATFSEEVWFKTASPQGVLMGFVNVTRYRNEVEYNRIAFIDAAGRLSFGTFNTDSTYSVLASPTAVTDNVWHHMVVTRNDSTQLMKMYLDGVLVATMPAGGSIPIKNGYWRLGCMQLTGWPGNVPRASECFKGNMQFAAAYGRDLTAAEVANHYAAGRP